MANTIRSIYKGFIYVITLDGKGTWKYEVSEDFKVVATNEGYLNIYFAELGMQDSVNQILANENENYNH